MFTEFDIELLAIDVAVIITPRSPTGGLVGAVYVVAAPLDVVVGDTVPQGTGEQETLQVTPSLLGSPLTVAVMDATPPTATVVVEAATLTLSPFGLND